MKCPECGLEVPENCNGIETSFCPFCGTRFSNIISAELYEAALRWQGTTTNFCKEALGVQIDPIWERVTPLMLMTQSKAWIRRLLVEDCQLQVEEVMAACSNWGANERKHSLEKG